MVEIYSRDQHKTEVIGFLQGEFKSQDWEVTHPSKGTGNETYFAQSNGQSYFIKLGGRTEIYQTMSSYGITPKVLAAGVLEDGTSILIQKRIYARKPTRKDFRQNLSKFGRIIRKTHQSESLKEILPKKISEMYKDVGLEVLSTIKQRWGKHKSKVSSCVEYVDESIKTLTHQIHQFSGNGLVASHNDICNANWLISQNGDIYLIDFELMSLDDPAADIGALLWWYYPEQTREEFLEIVGHGSDECFRNRMRIRMAVHCLNIILPRENSFDKFVPDLFDARLEDFRAIMAGQENPNGYNKSD